MRCWLSFATVEREELNAVLRADVTARTIAAQTLMDDAALAEELRAGQMESLLAADSGGMLGASQHSPTTERRARFHWRPLAAAAAGVVFGLLCASVAWAVASPRAMATALRLFALADGSFEKGSGRVASGFPSEFGKRSGDAAEVVAGEANVGMQALRFVRADREPALPNYGAASCDGYQLVDLRSLKAENAPGEATLELSMHSWATTHGMTRTANTRLLMEMASL